MILNEDQISGYKKNGYIIIKGFFPEKTIRDLFYQIKEVFALQMQHLLGEPLEKSLALGQQEFSDLMYKLYDHDAAVFSNCGKQVQHLVELHELGLSKKLMDVLKELGLAKPILSVRPCVLMNNVKLDKKGAQGNYWRKPSHQDWYYSQGSLDSVTVWTPYVFCDKELGVLEFVPGSHLHGLQNSDKGNYGELAVEPGDEKFESYDMAPGDIIIFASFLIHRSGVNTTNRVRWSTQFRFSNLLEPSFIERKFPNPFIYQPTNVLETPGFPKEEDLKKQFL